MIDFSKIELMQFPKLMEAELASQSDRGLAVLGSAGLEFILEQLLSGHLRDDKAKAQVFQGNGPLSTFSSRVTLAFLLGLISEDEHAELQIVRRVRNLLTHEIGSASLSSQRISDLCANLQLCERLYAPPEIPFTDLPTGGRGIPADPRDYPLLPKEALILPNKHEPRVRFANSIQVLLRVLVGRTVMATKVTSPDEFTSPEQPVAAGFEKLRLGQEKLAKLHARLAELRKEVLDKGETLPPELREDLPASTDEVMSDRQLRIYMQLGHYSNEVIRRSKLASDFLNQENSDDPDSVHGADQ